MESKWSQAMQLGFNQISFPIIVKDGFDLDIVTNLLDFVLDPELYLFEFDNSMELIDSTGQLWTWKYDINSKINSPGRLVKVLTLSEVKDIIKNCIQGSKNKEEIDHIITNSYLIKELLNSLSTYFSYR